MQNYPKAIKYKNIKREKRICTCCGNEIIGKSDFYVTEIERGKYLCYACERNKKQTEI